MPIFVVTGFPTNYDPPEDESIVLPPGAGRRFKGVPFGVTEDTAAVLRTLSYLDELTESGPETGEETPPVPSEEPPPNPVSGPEYPTSALGEIVAAAYATHVIPLALKAGLGTGDDTPEPVQSGRARKSKE